MTKIGKTRDFHFGDAVIPWLGMMLLAFFTWKLAKLKKTNANKEGKKLQKFQFSKR